jgi:citrate lyase subunit beta / citryl-CoA lyase
VNLTGARSLLFVPGDRPERFAKAEASGADVVVLDLEDAVAPSAKAEALSHVVAWLGAGHHALVRINAVGAPTHAAELAALPGVTVMLPKTESAAQVESIGAPVVALLETPVGIRDADAIAAAEGVVRLALGTVDLGAELGVDPASYAAMAYSRGRLVVASAAAGLPGPIDGVTVALDDPARLDADLAVSRDLGLTAKLCIHPRQVETVNSGFAPSAEEVAWARRILDAAAGGGVVVVDGAMVDAPVVTRARRIVERASRA